MNSSASGPDGLLFFSTVAFSSTRCRPRACRSSSVAVKPNRATRSISVNSAVSPRSTPPCATSAFSDVTSARAHENAAAGLGRKKRRVRLLRDLVETGGQHPAEQPLGHQCAVRADGGLVARGHLGEDADGCSRHFGIGHDRIRRFRVDSEPRSRAAASRDAAAGIAPKRDRICASTDALSKSPTATTAIMSGRYQSA